MYFFRLVLGFKHLTLGTKPVKNEFHINFSSFTFFYRRNSEFLWEFRIPRIRNSLAEITRYKRKKRETRKIRKFEKFEGCATNVELVFRGSFQNRAQQACAKLLRVKNCLSSNFTGLKNLYFQASYGAITGT